MLAAAMLFAGGVAALGQEAEQELPTVPVEVTVHCASSPERVAVTNNTAKPLQLVAVGSTHHRRAGEPYAVRKTLKPGTRASYTFGTGRGKGKRLSGSFVFDNEAPGEGVLVKTSSGTVRISCVDGTNAPPEPQPEELAQSIVELVTLGEPVDALALLDTLSVEPEVEEGYERALFRHWVDADGDGCDTREAVLIDESLTPAVLSDGCRVESGTWYSLPDGDTLTNPASVDINHVVPLKEAWASGASSWSPERREAFANDLLDERTLQAVSSGANRQQGEADPASWLPADHDAACRFVADWVAIKASWAMSIDELERDVVLLTLGDCAGRAVVVLPRDAVGRAVGP